jgi:hypothetical protein
MKSPLRQQGVKAEKPTDSLLTPNAPAWFAGLQSRQWLQYLLPSLQCLLISSCELLATDQDRLTIAAPTCWMPTLKRRREEIELAASRAMGRPIAVDLFATDAEPAGGAQ